MEVEEIQTPACKFARVGNNGRNDSSNKIGQKGGGAAGLEQYPADDEEDGGGGGIKRIAFGGSDNRLRGWHHHSSRIYRVSRASGGKDRHSKVVTSKGLRDRRVRLSVSTAIAFYDLQDRLGYDQPSKAVEWLIKAAAEAIAELPSLNSPFSDTPLKQLSDGKRGSAGMDQGLIDSADVELDDGDPNYQHQHQQQQQVSLSKSACSSTSETSKGSALSLSRPDVRVNRVKARERARERAAKEKEKENESLIADHQQHQQQNVHNPISQNSFTELLNAGLSSVSNNTSSTTASGHQSPAGGGGGEPDLFHKQPARHHQQWPNSISMSDYFATGFLGGGGASSSRTNHHSSGGFLGQIQLGNSLPQSIAVVPPFSLGGDSNNHHHHHQELQHYSFLPDHLTTQPGGGNDYNLNFTISSSSLAGFNRGTLQSNSVQPSVLSHHHLQRFSPIDGSNNLPFFTGTATAAPPPPSAASAPLENHHNHPFHHQFAPGFDGRSLQLYHGDGSRHSDQKGKEKN